MLVLLMRALCDFKRKENDRENERNREKLKYKVKEKEKWKADNINRCVLFGSQSLLFKELFVYDMGRRWKIQSEENFEALFNNYISLIGHWVTCFITTLIGLKLDLSSTMVATARSTTLYMCYMTCLEIRFYDYLGSSEVRNELIMKTRHNYAVHFCKFNVMWCKSY